MSESEVSTSVEQPTATAVIPSQKHINDEMTKDPQENANNAMPALELNNLEDSSKGNTPSEGNTPRDCETSSSSASPIPDDHEPPKRKVNLGRDISLMMQALNSLHSPEEKLAALCKKYADLLQEEKNNGKRLRIMERKLQQSGKEKDQMQKELNKAILAKSRMESLARELNKQNKLLKEESVQMTVSHNKERELVSAKFQTATDEISGRINAIADRNEVLNERNHEMSEKIEKMLEESVTREKMVKKVMEQRDLQEKILELKAKEAEGERDAALVAIKDLRVQVEKSKQMYEEQEIELKKQIAFYSNKVAMFQTTLDKSNEVFAKFRTEMDGMGKSIKTLEKAAEYWKKCCNELTIEATKLKSELKSKEEDITRLNVTVQKLSDLCRALQLERHKLAKSTETKATEKLKEVTLQENDKNGTTNDDCQNNFETGATQNNKAHIDNEAEPAEANTDDLPELEAADGPCVPRVPLTSETERYPDCAQPVSESEAIVA